jgi:predicted amidophosphoribosyltransferase
MDDPEDPRLKREVRTLAAMVGLYCHGHHSGPRGQLCTDCQDLLDYALFRLSKCPFQAAKPTCAHCPVHCYKPARRKQIRIVMRYAGPRMLLHHPVAAVLHLLDGLRKLDLTQYGPKE